MDVSTAAMLTLILVPGAWHNSVHYELLRMGLQSRFQERGADHTIVVLDLPTADKLSPSSYTKDDDANLIRDKVLSLVDAGKDVVLLAHSYGGIPTSQVPTNLSLWLCTLLVLIARAKQPDFIEPDNPF